MATLYGLIHTPDALITLACVDRHSETSVTWLQYMTTDRTAIMDNDYIRTGLVAPLLDCHLFVSLQSS